MATMKQAGFENAYSLAFQGDLQSVTITRALFLEKIAKEKGLI